MSVDNLTWNEFKDIVGQQLIDKGISGDEEIWYIDISFPSEIDVEFDVASGIAIGG